MTLQQMMMMEYHFNRDKEREKNMKIAMLITAVLLLSVTSGCQYYGAMARGIESYNEQVYMTPYQRATVRQQRRQADAMEQAIWDNRINNVINRSRSDYWL